MSIRVITHNGKPPAEGGKRYGYLVGDLFFPWGTSNCLTRAQACALFVPAKPVVRKTTIPNVVYAELPKAVSSSQACYRCLEGNNPIVRILTADRGMMSVAKCRLCGTLHQPSQTPEPAEEIAERILSDEALLPSLPEKKKPAQKKTAKPKKSKGIVFSKLVRAVTHKQGCYFCGFEPNHISRAETDEGAKMLVECGHPDCGKFMRPFAKRD
ncbi:MAG: hypothetical protein WC528_01275 [Patescibacteria group bacterium]